MIIKTTSIKFKLERFMDPIYPTAFKAFDVKLKYQMFDVCMAFRFHATLNLRIGIYKFQALYKKGFEG